ncbi:ADP-ribose pyrophosphatase [Veronia nyctiphanis]|uniref:GDP-mannose pyrophosphatase n=1 Tax=Veronia nyctiphanis TaxID=1278244 RepID=A0A4V1LTA2_9GAMM|nr:NUDIX hydrolase [Veronia nyctiphanis]RXJ74488.1 ADP-ribose pyrophosphatase [Veronia nyctiphanis]
MAQSETIHRWKRFRLCEDTVDFPDGKTAKQTIVRHPGAALIVPIQGDHLFLLRQYRPALDRWIFEFPAGTIEENESPIACAKRELQEETQHVADCWTELGAIHPAPGFCDEEMYLYVASSLAPKSGQPDDDEYLDVISLSVDEVSKLIRDNEITDCKTITAFTLATLKGLIPQ